MLQSFGVLDGDNISTKNSKYAAYYISKLKKLPPKGVINYSDIFDEKFMGCLLYTSRKRRCKRPAGSNTGQG